MRARLGRLLALGALLASTAAPASARACTSPSSPSTTTHSTCIDADELWPHAGAGPFFALGAASTAPAGRVAFGVVGSWLSEPIGLRVASPDPHGTTIFAVESAIDATLLVALGITDRLELTIAAPMTILQSGDGTADFVGDQNTLTRSALRDVRLGFAVSLPPARAAPAGGSADGFGLVARFEFALPTATPGAFAGSPTLTFAPTVAASYRRGRVLVAAEAGGRLRGVSELGSSYVGSSAEAELGVAVDVLPRKLGVFALEGFVLPSLVKQAASEVNVSDAGTHAVVPAEWIASISSAPLFDGDAAVALGGGGPIPFATVAPVGEPRFRFDLSFRYAPSTPARRATTSARAAAATPGEPSS